MLIIHVQILGKHYAETGTYAKRKITFFVPAPSTCAWEQNTTVSNTMGWKYAHDRMT